MSTLHIIKMIPRFDGENFIELTRSLNDMLAIVWPFLSKIIYRLERLEPILSGSREGEGNTSDVDDNDSNSSNVSGHDSGSLNEEPQNSDDIKA